MSVTDAGTSSTSSTSKEGGESANLVVHIGYAFAICSYDGNEIVHLSVSASEQKSVWYFDSGASRHIISYKELFKKLNSAPGDKKVSCANNSSYAIKGTGEIVLTLADGRELCLPNVLYVPGIKKNILSVSSFMTRGYLVHFEDDKCIVRDKEHENQLATIGTLENGLFVLDTHNRDENACMTKMWIVHM